MQWTRGEVSERNDPILISIITPTKDRPDLLARALESVRSQDDAGWEVRVVDDGHGEGLQLVESLADARIHAEMASGSGQVDARNQAIRAARGDALAWLDDDDWWEDRHHLSRARTILDEGPHLVYQTGWIVFEDSERRELFPHQPREADFRHYNQLLTSSVVYPQDLHRLLGPLDPGVGSYFDWDWYLRTIASGTPLHAIEEPGICYSVHSANVSTAYRHPRRLVDFERFKTKHALDVPILNHVLMHEELGRQRVERHEGN